MSEIVFLLTISVKTLELKKMSCLMCPAWSLTNATISLLSAIAAFVGVLFLIFAYVEYKKLKGLEDKIEEWFNKTKKDMELTQKATHKIIASYFVEDPNLKIKLLKEAEKIYPQAYNLYNSMGYAYIDKKDYQKAIECFHKAIQYRPKDPAGYSDLAYAYHLIGNKELSEEYKQKALELDPQTEFWF